MIKDNIQPYDLFICIFFHQNANGTDARMLLAWTTNNGAITHL